MTPADGTEKQDHADSQDHAPAAGSVTSGQSHTPGPTQALLAHLSMIEWALMEASSLALPEHEAARAAALRWIREEGPQGAYALLFGVERQRDGLLEALKASQGIEPLLNELSDCLPDERRALEREYKAIRKQVEAAIAQAERYEARTAEG